MLLDEPFAGIDPIAVNDIQQIVRSLKDRNIGVIISDHNVEQTLDIVDRAYIMYEGQIRVAGSVSELVWNDEVAMIAGRNCSHAQLRIVAGVACSKRPFNSRSDSSSGLAGGSRTRSPYDPRESPADGDSGITVRARCLVKKPAGIFPANPPISGGGTYQMTGNGAIPVNPPSRRGTGHRGMAPQS